MSKPGTNVCLITREHEQIPVITKNNAVRATKGGSGCGEMADSGLSVGFE